jgi:hypothetical protein
MRLRAAIFLLCIGLTLCFTFSAPLGLSAAVVLLGIVLGVVCAEDLEKWCKAVSTKFGLIVFVFLTVVGGLLLANNGPRGWSILLTGLGASHLIYAFLHAAREADVRPTVGGIDDQPRTSRPLPFFGGGRQFIYKQKI